MPSSTLNILFQYFQCNIKEFLFSQFSLFSIWVSEYKVEWEKYSGFWNNVNEKWCEPFIEFHFLFTLLNIYVWLFLFCMFYDWTIFLFFLFRYNVNVHRVLPLHLWYMLKIVSFSLFNGTFTPSVLCTTTHTLLK